MKHFTLSSFRRAALSAAALFIVSLSSFAGNTYYAFYAKVNSYPTGKGEIYVSESAGVPENEREYASSAEVKEVSEFFQRYVYAKPAPGYIFAGMSQDTVVYNDYGEEIGFGFSGEISNIGNPAYITYISNITDNDGTDPTYNSNKEVVEGMMPLDPNGQFSAVFTRVVIEYATGHDKFGDISINKVVNDLGDQLTIKAVPADSKCHFDRWTLNGQTVSTDAEYHIMVTDSARYVAHFTCDTARFINFPAEGGWMPYYNYDQHTTISENACTYAFHSTYVEGAPDSTFIPPYMAMVNIQRNYPTYIYGKGEVVLTFENDDLYSHETLLNRWSGDNGVSVDTLDPRNAYYIADMDAHRLNRVSGVVAPNQIYVSVPDSFLTEIPDVLFFSAEDAKNATGIEAVKAIDVKGLGRVYTIEGREVALPEENKLYIIDGKKVIYRKK